MLGAASNLSWRQLEKPRLEDADFYFFKQEIKQDLSKIIEFIYDI